MRKDLNSMRQLYLYTEGGLTDQEVADLLGISRATAWRWRQVLGCRIVAPGRYTLRVTQEDVKQATAQAKALTAKWNEQERDEA